MFLLSKIFKSSGPFISRMAKKKRLIGKKVILPAIIALMIALIAAAYFVIFYTPECKDAQCFVKAMNKCSKASFLNEQDSAIWQYRIRFSLSKECLVDVKAVEIKTDMETSAALKGKEMRCYLPKDVAGSFMPEERLEYCHGVLKEDMQDLMIKRMQTYVIKNIEQIK